MAFCIKRLDHGYALMHILSMTLAEYIVAQDLTQQQVAVALSVTQPTISKVLEKGTASVELALAVEKWSDGVVPAESLSKHVELVRSAA
jgi:transcriptional regulator with XRE-family HTH domain